MLVSRSRDKLINAILYFAGHTRGLGKIKLFKLLYLLDFEHFRQTGRPVTGMEYRAWKMGPVPAALVQIWDDLDPDLDEAIEIRPEKVYDYVRENVIAKRTFDNSHFTPRELRILGELASSHAEDLSEKLIDVTHDENGAWARVWQDGAGNDQVINYRLVLADNDPNRDAILQAAVEYEAVERANAANASRPPHRLAAG
ncbi:MAG: SocA family protein [Burkholderiales bacterium]|nr:SocA family protein [Burkholderiales bacterium]